jgi:hypothetical protein
MALNGGILSSSPILIVSHNPRLTSLKGLHPQTFSIAAEKCGFTDLTSFPQIVQGRVLANDNNITHLKGIGKDYLRHVYGYIDLLNCPIESNVLGLMRIIGLTRINLGMNDYLHPLGVPLYNVMTIINNNLRKPSPDLLECKEELMASGYKKYAQL